MAPVASVVDTYALVKAVWVAIAAGIGITAAFAFALVGSSAQEARQHGDAIRMGLDGLLGLAGLGVFAAGIVLDLIAMATK